MHFFRHGTAAHLALLVVPPAPYCAVVDHRARGVVGGCESDSLAAEVSHTHRRRFEVVGCRWIAKRAAIVHAPAAHRAFQKRGACIAEAERQGASRPAGIHEVDRRRGWRLGCHTGAELCLVIGAPTGHGSVRANHARMVRSSDDLMDTGVERVDDDRCLARHVSAVHGVAEAGDRPIFPPQTRPRSTRRKPASADVYRRSRGRAETRADVRQIPDVRLTGSPAFRRPARCQRGQCREKRSATASISMPGVTHGPPSSVSCWILLVKALAHMRGKRHR